MTACTASCFQAHLAASYYPIESTAMSTCNRIFMQRLLRDTVYRRDAASYEACVRRALNPDDRHFIGRVKILPTVNCHCIPLFFSFIFLFLSFLKTDFFLTLSLPSLGGELSALVLVTLSLIECLMVEYFCYLQVQKQSEQSKRLRFKADD